jgi:hypothetical protein
VSAQETPWTCGTDHKCRAARMAFGPPHDPVGQHRGVCYCLLCQGDAQARDEFGEWFAAHRDGCLHCRRGAVYQW